MADLKITQLTEETLAADNEPLAIVQDPAGTPITKKIQTKNLLRKAATFIIASSTSVGGADYVCDGTDDDVQIQAAIDALPSTGGKVLLREGTFNIGASINIGKNGVTLEGQGYGTKIFLENAKNVHMITLGDASVQYYNTTIRDIYFDGNQANQSSAGSIIENKTSSNPIYRVTVENCQFVNAYDCNIFFGSTIDNKIKGCIFENWKGANNGCGVLISDTIVEGCIFLGNNTTAQAVSRYGGDNSVVANCRFYMPNSFNTECVSGIDLVSSNYIHIGSSAGSSCKAIRSCTSAVGNYIEFGASADVGSYGIYQASTEASGNLISGSGIGIFLATGANPSAFGNALSSLRADGIQLNISGAMAMSNSIKNCGQATDNTYAGIKISNTYCKVIGNTIQNTLTNKLQYGIREASNLNGPSIITNNIATDAVTAQISTQNGSTVSANNLTA